MLMTAKRYANKVQEYAARMGIDNQFKLRLALREKGVTEATARSLWMNGVTDDRKLRVIRALAELLQVDPDELIEKPK